MLKSKKFNRYYNNVETASEWSHSGAEFMFGKFCIIFYDFLYNFLRFFVDTPCILWYILSCTIVQYYAQIMCRNKIWNLGFRTFKCKKDPKNK